MRKRGIDRRNRRLAAAVVLASLAAGSCAQIERVVRPGQPAGRPAILEGSEIPLVLTRFAGEPRELYSAGDRFRFKISFDPEIADLDRIEAFGIWAQDRPGGPWRRVDTVPAKVEPAPNFFVPPADGAYGFRPSAVYAGGAEILVPGPSDKPLVWLYVDRTPPKLTWIAPASSFSITADRYVDLVWGASEMRFGEAPAIIEWSADGGVSWTAVDRVKASRGTGRLGWLVPEAAGKPDARPLVRITAWDLVGNRTVAVLPLKVKPAPGTAPLLAGRAKRKAPKTEAASASAIVPSSHRKDAGEASAEKREAAGPPPAAPSSPAARPEAAAAEPSVCIQNLDAGTVLPGGAGRYFFFSMEGLDLDRTRVTVEWRPSAGEAWKKLGRAVTGRDGKFFWKLPASTTEATLRLTAVDARPEGTAKAVAEATISIDAAPPSAAIRGIARGPHGEPLVTIEAADQGPAGLAGVRLFVTADGGSSWKEVPVEDPARPVAVDEPGEKLGFFAAASDRAGNSTPLPEAGTAPQDTFESAGRPAVMVDDFEEACLRGGDQRYVTWRFQGGQDLKALVEASLDAAASWEPVGEAPVSSGKILWIVPGENGTAICRVRVRLADGSMVEGRTKPVRIDAAAPQLDLGQVPAKIAGELKIPLALTDPAGCGIDGVAAFLRPADGEPGGWTARPAGKTVFDEDSKLLTISVADLEEGAYDLFLSARDRAGNGGLSPTATTPPLGRFAVDRSPVVIRVTPTALPWVEGMTAAVQVEMDLADAVPPLRLEERTADGWTEVFRWETLSTGDDLYRFPIPGGRESYEVRFSIRDAAGNTAHAAIGPRPVERSIQIASLDQAGDLKTGVNQPIAWSIHPALAEIASQLKVVAAHQPKEGSDWVQVFDGGPASTCTWTVPAADGDVHRLRVSLLHKGNLVGQDTSGPLRIAAAPARAPRVEPQVVPISEDSFYYSKRADIQMDQFRATRAQYQKWFAEATASLRRDASGNLLPGELEKLSPELRREARERERQLGEAVQKIRENYQKALDLDSKNYRAAYGMAQVIHRTSPDKVEDAIRYLERAVEIKGDHAPALNDLGASRILRGEYEAAEEPLRRALAVEDNGSYHYNLALALFHQGKTAESRVHLEDALAKGGTSVRTGEVYYYIVSAFVQEGLMDEARRRFALYGDQIPASLRESLSEALGR